MIKKYFILPIFTLVLAGCTSEDISNTPDEERLPLRLEATLSSGSPVTRAYDNTFEENDTLRSYVQHVYKDGNTYTEASGIQASLVAFTKGTATMDDTDEESVKQTSDLTPGKALYWDDFSNSSSKGTDLRTADHGLRSYYGYCYNGTKIGESDLDIPTGVLKWTTTADQSADGAMKKNDLLWSATQAPVTYEHEKTKREGLKIPFTHAMSKFTIVLVAGEGFVAGDLDAAKVTLCGMNLTGEFTAPTATVTASGTTTVKMFANAASTTTDSKPCRAYEAVTVPTTELTKDTLLATVEDMGGNTYKVYVTEGLLNSWATGLSESKTKSGYNYKLTVTLNKQAVGVVATLANWNDVSATGTGEIQFSADVKTIDKSNVSGLKDGDSFSLWRSTDKSDMGSIVTIVSYKNGEFVNTPAIYWPNINDSYYFRALAEKTNDHLLKAVTTTDVAQGTDLLWGTTAAHKGTLADNTEVNYDEGVAINPRTGDVPIVFRHAMSNVTITLKTAASTDSAYVNLDGVKVTLTKIYSKGKIDIESGAITTIDSQAEVTMTGSTIMVPQGLDDVVLEITLSDNATKYKMPLNTCVDKSNNKISKWESGKDYTYEIKLTKEAVKFLVQVEDWTPLTGSGNATLDWD